MSTGLVGRAGELLVAAELLRTGVDVAFPASDTGIDMFAYRQMAPTRMVPVQVKTWSGSGYAFERMWFRIPGIALVQVFHVATTPEFYVFRDLGDVEAALGEASSATTSWRTDGAYSSPSPVGRERLERRRPFQNAWSRITDLIPPP